MSPKLSIQNDKKLGKKIIKIGYKTRYLKSYIMQFANLTY